MCSTQHHKHCIIKAVWSINFRFACAYWVFGVCVTEVQIYLLY